jgi:predicted membrane protein
MNRTHTIPPSVNKAPNTHNDPLAVLFLGMTVIVMTSFDYVWYGPFPLWLILVVAGFFISVMHSSHRRNLQKMLSHTFLWVILPWIFFVIMVTVVDILTRISHRWYGRRPYLVA